MAHDSARKLALNALIEWRQGRHFADAILQQLLASSALGVSDRAFATELFYGVLRNLTLLDFWISLLRSAPVDDTSRDLLRLGFYQLFILRTPGHAAVFETVALASARRRSLVNGVLRTAQRRFDELDAAAAAAPLPVRQSHPAFLIERWVKSFGEEATDALCAWDNTPAPIYARMNHLKISAEQPEGTPLLDAPDFVLLDRLPTEALARGEYYIQDPSTRIACELLAPQPGESVLDACAAPGGKTGLLAQLMQNRGTLVACDRDPTRVETLSQNLERLGVTIARVVQHDWRGALGGENAQSFDRILIDTPCTNTGVMRRRVDVRWRLQPADFIRMQSEQLVIIAAVLPLLKPGGTLVYSTCSIDPEENEAVVAHTLRGFPFLQLIEQRSVLPFHDGFDGAFAAHLTRTA